MSTATAQKPSSATAWKKAREHTVTLPSSAVVTITIPNLARMMKAGEIPNQLVEAAIGAQEKRQITREDIERDWEFTSWLIPQMVVEPKIKPEEVGDLPAQDLELLVAFATRNTDLDAVGHQLGGLETQRSFRDFRGLISTDESALSL
jgi:hypothetical protein